MALAAACSAPVGTEDGAVLSSSSAIVNGTPSPEEEDFVVHIFAVKGGSCTGTLIAPNVVLTALHCVSEYDPLAAFTCDEDGVLHPVQTGGGEIGALFEPERVEVRVGPDPTMSQPVRAVRIFGSGSRSVCRSDIAVVVLDTELSPEPQRVRLGTRTRQGEMHTVIGYGQDETGALRVRNRRSGVAVLSVGAFGQYERQGKAAPLTFVVGESGCHGDSGGPAFSEETGAVTGVYSLVTSAGCTAAGVRNVLTQVAAFERLLREAMEYAGAELLVEQGTSEPMGGAGGEGAGGNGEPGVGGKPAGSAGDGSGGGATPAGSGGTGANSNGEAGGDPSSAASGGTRVGEGSGSREDPSCTCRMDGLTARGSSGWVALIAALAGSIARRRRR